MSFFGGGSKSAPPSTPATQTQFLREAPGIEERKIELMDIARQVAQQPINLPAVQAAPAGALEQLGFTQAGTTGVGAPTVQQGIAQIQAAAAPVGQAQINQFLNPYQSYVTDEIARQGQMAQNQLASNAIGAGAFGGAREGIQRAELQRATQANIGQSLAQGFQSAAGLAAQQQGIQQAGGQLLGALGGQQQAMQQADIASLLQAGGVQRQLGQQALDAQRATTMARSYEPYQRLEFLKGIMTNLPTSQSAVTATTAPGSNPLAQAVGTGIGAYAAYNMGQRRY